MLKIMFLEPMINFFYALQTVTKQVLCFYYSCLKHSPKFKVTVFIFNYIFVPLILSLLLFKEDYVATILGLFLFVFSIYMYVSYKKTEKIEKMKEESEMISSIGTK